MIKHLAFFEMNIKLLCGFQVFVINHAVSLSIQVASRNNDPQMADFVESEFLEEQVSSKIFFFLDSWEYLSMGFIFFL